MFKIISLLLSFFQALSKFLWLFYIFFNNIIWFVISHLASFIKSDFIKSNKSISSPDYLNFKVDEPPISINYESNDSINSLDWKKLIKDNNILPIKRVKTNSVPFDLSCPFCNAPSSFIYSRKSQNKGYSCKCCNNHFSDKAEKLKAVSFKCPHCNHFLEKHKKRKSFILYKCKNDNCPFYLNNLNKYKNLPNSKLRFIYRAFNVSFDDINIDYKDFINSPVSLSNIHNSSYIVGLCLTYHINYGLSTRQTASILKDIHDISISHQTVDNYCKSVSNIVHPILEFYPYDLSNNMAGDETYISINGIQYYVFFIFDAVKKIITSYRVFEKRDSLSAIKAIYSTLIKLSSSALTLITDGNPIYNVAVFYWNKTKKYNIALKQVIGLKNTNQTSTIYRSEKQIIERLNRTLKYFYRPKGAFSSLDSANNYMVLFSVFFNFLRPHEALNHKVPVELFELINKTNMIDKWLSLIKLGETYSKIYY